MRRLAARPWIGADAWDCPAGWLPILERATAQIARWVPAPGRTSQIKEKFGTLRWYVSCEDRRTVIIDVAELASAQTFLACGASGRLRTERLWILQIGGASGRERGGQYGEERGGGGS